MVHILMVYPRVSIEPALANKLTIQDCNAILSESTIAALVVGTHVGIFAWKRSYSTLCLMKEPTLANTFKEYVRSSMQS